MNINQVVSKEDTVLITRITDIKWIYEEKISNENATMFAFNIDVEIENPSNNTIFMWCDGGHCPYPFVNMSLTLNHTVEIFYGGHYGIFNISFPIGVLKHNRPFWISIYEYNSTKLPMGNYIFWYEFSIKSTYPTRSYYSYMHVSETEIEIYHEWNNETLVLDREIPFPDTSMVKMGQNLVFSCLIFLVVRKKEG